eukprot:gene24233-468_t
MLSATARAALLLAIVGIAAADPRMVKCVGYTDEANQKMTKGWSLADHPVAAAVAKGGGFVVTLPAGSTGVWVQVKGTTIADPGPSGGTTIIKASPPAPDGC